MGNCYHVICYMDCDTRVISTNSMLFPLYNCELTFEHTFVLPTFVNMLLGGFHEAFLSFEGTGADYVNHNNHRKHANRSNNRVSVPTRVVGYVRND